MILYLFIWKEILLFLMFDIVEVIFGVIVFVFGFGIKLWGLRIWLRWLICVIVCGIVMIMLKFV